MQIFHNRQQLISWLEDNAPDRVISTALQQGEVELLGGFHPVAGSSYPGFIVKVIAMGTIANIPDECCYINYRPDSYIGIVIDNHRHKIRSFRVKEPNWKKWIGYKSNNVLYMGDNYEENLEQYEKAKDVHNT